MHRLDIVTLQKLLIGSARLRDIPVSRVGLCLQKRPAHHHHFTKTAKGNRKRLKKVRTALTLFTDKTHTDRAKWRRARELDSKDAPLHC